MRTAVFLSCFITLTANVSGAGNLLCACPGDCDASCGISTADFNQVVAAVFDPSQHLDCDAADTDGDGRVTAADVLNAHRARLAPPDGCSAEPIATTTPTPSNTERPSPTATSPPTQTATPVGTPVSRWISLPPLARGPRQEVGVAHLDGLVYVIGGFAPLPTDRVEAYDIASNTWIDVAPLPTAGHHIGAAALGGFVYAIGGLRSPGFTPTSEVLRYDPTLDRWDPVAPLPTARGAMAVAVAGDRIHALAGDAGGAVRDHAAYDPAQNRWIELAPYPIAREHIAAAAVDDVVYVAGGRSPLTTAAHRWDAAAGVWLPLPAMPTNRAGHAAAELHGRFVVFGGEGNVQNSRGIFPEVEAYDPSTNSWTRLAIMASPRHGIGAATVGNRIYVPGGADVLAFGAVATHDALEIDF